MNARRLLWLVFIGASGALHAWGHTTPESTPNDSLTSLSYISYLERYATIFPASQKESLDAVVNMPILPGDRMETARGSRAEIHLADGSTVWLDQFTTLDFDAIAWSRGSSAQRTVLFLAAGTLALEVGPNAPSMRLDTKAGTVYLAKNGLYRLEVKGDRLRVATVQGTAELPAGLGSTILRAGLAAWVVDGEAGSQFAWAGDSDEFWQWVMERRTPPAASTTARYVQNQTRAYILDSYGDWVYVTELGAYGWRPRVSLTWVPYSFGRWYWTPVGWSWVSYEPWGWYPYHYGSWYFSVGIGWVWFWDSVWAPAWVHWIYTPGYVGWCPRGYYDWWWWHHCNHCRFQPRRWNEVTFDFSGRVHFRDVDPRPWTLVPEDRFTYSHIEQVRLEPERFFRTVGSDRQGYVRSGPLLPRPDPDGKVSFRSYFDNDPKPSRDVARLLRRKPPGENELPPIRLTNETGRLARLHLDQRSGEGVATPPRRELESPRRGQAIGEPSLRHRQEDTGRRSITAPPWESSPNPPSTPARRPSSWDRGSREGERSTKLRRPLDRMPGPSEEPGGDRPSSQERRIVRSPITPPPGSENRTVVPRTPTRPQPGPISPPTSFVPRSPVKDPERLSPPSAPTRPVPAPPSVTSRPAPKGIDSAQPQHLVRPPAQHLPPNHPQRPDRHR
ncbi:MAG: DUF6600 domain-containing protein [Thermoanaerobaculaceae bacterium]